MNIKLENYLYTKYPKIFPKVEKTSDASEPFELFGFECGDGWFRIIYWLSEYIQNQIDQQNKWAEKQQKECKNLNFFQRLRNCYKTILNRRASWSWLEKIKYCYNIITYGDPYVYKTIPQVRALQVKEKFGGLRFYYSGGDEKIAAVVSFVEAISYYFCETTGQFENVGYNKKGWIKTHHVSLAKIKDFNFIDDEELIKILEEIKQENNNNNENTSS